MAEPPTRHLEFDFVLNLRDLGGYEARDGRRVAWRRLYRSGELRHRTTDDLSRLQQITGLASVLDLRSDEEIRQERVGLLSEAGIRYHNVPFLTGDGPDKQEDDIFSRFSNLGWFYVSLMKDREFGSRLVKSLELITEPVNRSLLFHCTLGKDRTGMLSAIILGALGVSDEDIIEDYTLSARGVQEFLRTFRNDPEVKKAIENLPAYFWEAAAESMSLFLTALRQEYGSVGGYLEAQCAGDSLIPRLEAALLD
jgi:protein-tyrosine phosphatase